MDHYDIKIWETELKFNYACLNKLSSLLFIDIIFPNDILNFIMLLYIRLKSIRILATEKNTLIFNNGQLSICGKYFNFTQKPHQSCLLKTKNCEVENIYNTKEIGTRKLIDSVSIVSNLFIKNQYTDYVLIHDNNNNRLNPSNVISFVSKNHLLVLTNEGLFGCGQNFFGQLGLGHNENKTRLCKINIQNVISFACGGDHSIVLTKDGVYGCGKNSYGQLGRYIHKSKQYFFKKIHIIQGDIVISVSCGDNHTFMLIKTGKLLVCGDNGYGQLGFNNELIKSTLTSPTVYDENKSKYTDSYMCNYFSENVLSIYCGPNYSFILTKEGLYGCGNNFFGQLGLEQMTNNYCTFTKIQNITDVISVSCGPSHTIILTKKGLFASGSNENGQLGLGDTDWRKKFCRITHCDRELNKKI